MTFLHRTATLAIGVLVVAASALRAQTAADPSGHWVGSIEIPGRTIDFQTDFARDSTGQLAGTIMAQFDDGDGFPLPLSRIVVDGTSVMFYARVDQQFHGVPSGDGTTMSGTTTLSGYQLPFGLRRTGDAQLAPAPTSAAVGKELEGDWNATLDIAGKSFRLVLTIANQSDGTALARIIDLDEGGLVIPVVVTQQASHLTYESRGVRGSFAGELNAARTELAGTWTQRGVSAPLSFQRAIK